MIIHSDDTELALEAAKGNATAFQQLLERHYDHIFRIAFRYVNIREDAEDIAQEVCCSLPLKLKSFRGDAKFSTWLYRVVLNATRDMHRKRSNRTKLHETFSEVAALERSEQAETAVELKWLYATLDQVGDDLRATAILVLAEGFNHAEAAEILDIKESTISWRMHELKKKLKQLAEEDA